MAENVAFLDYVADIHDYGVDYVLDIVDFLDFLDYVQRHFACR